MQEEEGTIVPYLEEEIGDTTYRACQLSLRRWADLTEHLAQMLGGPFAKALRSGNINPDVLADGDVMALALASVMERLTAKMLLGLLEFAIGGNKEAGALRLEGGRTQQPHQWHRHFQRNMAHLAPAVALFLRAQYADFFEGLRTLRPERTSDTADREASTPPSSTLSPST